MPRRDLLVTAAILRDKGGRVLLVGNDWQGLGRVRFTLPGGVVESGEVQRVGSAEPRVRGLCCGGRGARSCITTRRIATR